MIPLIGIILGNIIITLLDNFINIDNVVFHLYKFRNNNITLSLLISVSSIFLLFFSFSQFLFTVKHLPLDIVKRYIFDSKWTRCFIGVQFGFIGYLGIMTIYQEITQINFYYSILILISSLVYNIIYFYRLMRDVIPVNIFSTLFKKFEQEIGNTFDNVFIKEHDNFYKFLNNQKLFEYTESTPFYLSSEKLLIKYPLKTSILINQIDYKQLEKIINKYNMLDRISKIEMFVKVGSILPYKNVYNGDENNILHFYFHQNKNTDSLTEEKFQDLGKNESELINFIKENYQSIVKCFNSIDFFEIPLIQKDIKIIFVNCLVNDIANAQKVIDALKETIDNFIEKYSKKPDLVKEHITLIVKDAISNIVESSMQYHNQVVFQNIDGLFIKSFKMSHHFSGLNLFNELLLNYDKYYYENNNIDGSKHIFKYFKSYTFLDYMDVYSDFKKFDSYYFNAHIQRIITFSTRYISLIFKYSDINNDKNNLTDYLNLVDLKLSNIFKINHKIDFQIKMTKLLDIYFNNIISVSFFLFVGVLNKKLNNDYLNDIAFKMLDDFLNKVEKTKRVFNTNNNSNNNSDNNLVADFGDKLFLFDFRYTDDFPRHLFFYEPHNYKHFNFFLVSYMIHRSRKELRFLPRTINEKNNGILNTIFNYIKDDKFKFGLELDRKSQRIEDYQKYLEELYEKPK